MLTTPTSLNLMFVEGLLAPGAEYTGELYVQSLSPGTHTMEYSAKAEVDGL